MHFDNIAHVKSILSPRHQRQFVLTIIFVIVNALLDVFSLASIIPLLLVILDGSVIHRIPFLANLFAAFGFSSDTYFISTLLIAILFLFILKNIVAVAITYYQSRFIYDVATEVAEREFNRYFHQDFLDHTADSSSLPARNILMLPIEFSVYILLAGITLFSEALVFCLILAGIAIYDPAILLLLTVVLAPPLLLMYFFKKDKLREVGEISEKLRPESLKHLYQGLDSFVEIKLYMKERFFIRKFMDALRPLNRNFALFNTLSAIPQRTIEAAAVAGMVAIILYGLLTHAGHRQLILLLGIFSAASFRVMPSLNRMFVALMNLKAFRYTIDILKGAPLSPGHPTRLTDTRPLAFTSSIEFDDISFTYLGSRAAALSNIRLTIRKGETVGLMGPSGVGKTTLINILLRFIREDRGIFRVDGRVLPEEEIPAWRALIGYVKQDPVILDGSILENVAFGEAVETIDRRRLQQSIRDAGLGDWVAGLPAGVDTMIGEQGARLSGGQRQRIAIARALYRRAQILIFDEATSELDAQTEQEVLHAIERLNRETAVTILIIAHRISTLQYCDRILELREGKISEEYRYAELLEMTGKKRGK